MSFEEAFKGKRILVTGAGRGLGRAVCKRLDGFGSVVYAVSKSADNLSTLKKECPNIITINVDLSDWDATRLAISKIDVVDCLVNNAGVYYGTTLMEIKPEYFDETMNVNVKALINVSQIVAGKMIQSKKPGVIVNVSSLSGRKAFPTTESYGISKAAVEYISKCLAIELGPHKIRVNTIAPGAFLTDMYGVFKSQKVHENVKEMLTKKSCLGEGEMPMEDVVNTLLFLLSNLSSNVTGESVAVDAGFLVN